MQSAISVGPALAIILGDPTIGAKLSLLLGIS